eukprot:TRINITY_DN676_c0_g3_i2.p1 TRINITY_DN676_c0_g3~~TRINITY_DN676_c0_g3_i2.p1  ORF type:complete len:264 (-),score=-0.62 TRINITY_DN676_c0_g3_i2:595-1386(-)
MENKCNKQSFYNYSAIILVRFAFNQMGSFMIYFIVLFGCVVLIKGQLRNCDNNMGRQVLIDLGANCGNSYAELVKKYGQFEQSYLWEINPLLFDQLQNLSSAHSDITLVQYGAWTSKTEMNLDLIGVERPDCSGTIENFWGGTSIVENDHNTKHKDYYKSVTAHTLDFTDWYIEHVCQQDEVTLKVDIERAEYALLSKMVAYGILCHPRRVLIEWHKPNEALVAPQHFKVPFRSQLHHCFGFINSLEYILQFCQKEPEFVRWT